MPITPIIGPASEGSSIIAFSKKKPITAGNTITTIPMQNETNDPMTSTTKKSPKLPKIRDIVDLADSI